MSHFYFGVYVNSKTVFKSPVGIVCMLYIIILDKPITRAKSVNDSSLVCLAFEIRKTSGGFHIEKG